MGLLHELGMGLFIVLNNQTWDVWCRLRVFFGLYINNHEPLLTIRNNYKPVLTLSTIINQPPTTCRFLPLFPQEISVRVSPSEGEGPTGPTGPTALGSPRYGLVYNYITPSNYIHTHTYIYIYTHILHIQSFIYFLLVIDIFTNYIHYTS